MQKRFTKQLVNGSHHMKSKIKLFALSAILLNSTSIYASASDLKPETDLALPGTKLASRINSTSHTEQRHTKNDKEKAWRHDQEERSYHFFDIEHMASRIESEHFAEENKRLLDKLIRQQEEMKNEHKQSEFLYSQVLSTQAKHSEQMQQFQSIIQDLTQRIEALGAENKKLHEELSVYHKKEDDHRGQMQLSQSKQIDQIKARLDEKDKTLSQQNKQISTCLDSISGLTKKLGEFDTQKKQMDELSAANYKKTEDKLKEWVKMHKSGCKVS